MNVKEYRVDRVEGGAVFCRPLRAGRRSLRGLRRRPCSSTVHTALACGIPIGIHPWVYVHASLPPASAFIDASSVVPQQLHCQRMQQPYRAETIWSVFAWHQLV